MGDLTQPARRPHRPRAGILDPVGSVSSIMVECATLHSTLDTRKTPQAVFDAIADAHHHLVIALRLLNEQGKP